MFESIFTRAKRIDGDIYKISLGHNRIGIIDFGGHKLTHKDIKVLKENIMKALEKDAIKVGDILRIDHKKSPIHKIHYKLKYVESAGAIRKFKVLVVRESR